MALRPQLFDGIVRIVAPTFTESTSRVFVFDAWDDTPGFVSVYIGRNAKPHLLHSSPIASFTRSRRPKREPHIITLQSGEEWLCYQAGCGCGSPIKRVTTRMAISDQQKLASTPAPDPAEELVGG